MLLVSRSQIFAECDPVARVVGVFYADENEGSRRLMMFFDWLHGLNYTSV